jgi:hypothetical protein
MYSISEYETMKNKYKNEIQELAYDNKKLQEYKDYTSKTAAYLQ